MLSEALMNPGIGDLCNLGDDWLECQEPLITVGVGGT